MTDEFRPALVVVDVQEDFCPPVCNYLLAFSLPRSRAMKRMNENPLTYIATTRTAH